MENKINFHAYENENIEKLFLEFPQKEKYLRGRISFFLIYLFLFKNKDNFKTLFF